jgi:hypothetical protein
MGMDRRWCCVYPVAGSYPAWQFKKKCLAGF